MQWRTLITWHEQCRVEQCRVGVIGWIPSLQCGIYQVHRGLANTGGPLVTMWCLAAGRQPAGSSMKICDCEIWGRDQFCVCRWLSDDHTLFYWSVAPVELLERRRLLYLNRSNMFELMCGQKHTEVDFVYPKYWLPLAIQFGLGVTHPWARGVAFLCLVSKLWVIPANTDCLFLVDLRWC